MKMTTQTETAIDFDSLYMNPPETKKELREMRGDHTLLLAPQVEEFCRQVVQLGRLPTVAYEVAFAIEQTEFDEELELNVKRWIKPDHPSYHASRLLKNKDVVARIKELRDEIVMFGQIERAEVIQTLKSIALDPDAKNSDRVSAAAQLNRMEGFNKEPEAGGIGGTLTLVLPFVPQKLVSAPVPKLIEGEVLDSSD
jgi:hypothetical protein